MYALAGGGSAGWEPAVPYTSPGCAGKEPLICWGGGCCCGTVLPAVPPYPYGMASVRLDTGGGTPEYGICMGMLFGSVSVGGDGFVPWLGW